MVEADALTAEVKKAEQALAAQQKEVERRRRRSPRSCDRRSGAEGCDRASVARSSSRCRRTARAVRAGRARAQRHRHRLATRDGLCSACHVRLRPQVFQEVRRNDQIIQCASCNRILYYVPPRRA
jgi:predicted  nucleic acid-binding Zn-ribbon protein